MNGGTQETEEKEKIKRKNTNKLSDSLSYPLSF